MAKISLIKGNNYPGDGFYYVLCDICGRKIRAKDAIYINDKFNLHSKLLVCKDDADETNPQTYIKAKTDRQLENPSIIRSEGSDRFVFIDTAAQIEDGDTSDPTGRNPGAPKQLSIVGGSASTVDLRWFGPDDSGSSVISGYKIERESPVGGGFSTLTSDSGSVATVYTDTTVSASTQYNYRVSAINNNGTGSASNEASITTNAS